MKIKDIYQNKKVVFSFEIFPPNENFSSEKLYKVIDELSIQKPDFISVTYGAGGTTKGGTIEMASYIKNKLNIETLTHLTCVGSRKDEIENFLNELERNNIENILALRGDISKDQDESMYNKGDFLYASDLIKAVRGTNRFSVGGAFYPEVHYENNDLIDLFNLKKKVDSGTDFLVSQIFFDNESFLDFRDKAEKVGINIPLAAGIIPVTNAKQIKRITSLCNCKIPKKLERILNAYEDNNEAMYQAGIAYASEQIIELLSAGIKGIHIYTMNKTHAVKEILENISSIRKYYE
ncbi:MAG: methylenetetrahydrofolate reductase [NAD(P)H] [Fusobacteriales bacterium]|jgi:methylenetetrahydrofolate reductase (NADPH)|nr:methylenetetrahydrofolate reductase [NAD(P)H] [Fusobacteriales bacterium]